MKTSRIGLGVALSAVFAAGAAWFLYLRAEIGRNSRQNYLKHEYRIPMRDGKTLFTQVYLPRDQTRTYPLLIQRTPFGVSPYGEARYRPQLGASPEFDRAGYIFVFQDVRGRFQSEGDFLDMRPHLDQPAPGQTDESTDMADTVVWLLKNIPSNNGRVGEPMRARFRRSFSSPEALQPDQVTEISYAMPDVNHTFIRGHRIVVQVQSSWFPLADLNPQSFVDIPGAPPSAFVKATQRVFHRPGASSSLILQVLTP